jgi:hypothetical protein
MPISKNWRLARGHASHENRAGIQCNHHSDADLEHIKIGHVMSHRTNREMAVKFGCKVQPSAGLPTELPVLAHQERVVHRELK